MNVTKQDVIGWANRGIECVKIGFNQVVGQIEEKLKDEALQDNECFKQTKSQVGDSAVARDVCEFKDRLAEMWGDKEEVDKPKTIADFVRQMRSHVNEIAKLYDGLLDKAMEIDGKARTERKELENRAETQKKRAESYDQALDAYRWYVRSANNADPDLKGFAAAFALDKEMKQRYAVRFNQADLKAKVERNMNKAESAPVAGDLDLKNIKDALYSKRLENDDN